MFFFENVVMNSNESLPPCSEESARFEGLLEFSEPSDPQNSLEFGLSQWKVQALTALKVGAAELRSMFLKVMQL